MKPRKEMTKEEMARYKQFLCCRKWLEAKCFDEAYRYARDRGFTLEEVYASVFKGYVPKPPRNWVPPDQAAAAPVDTTPTPAQVVVASDVKPPAPTVESALTIPEPERKPAPATEALNFTLGTTPALWVIPESATKTINSWPVETEAMIFNTCRNKKLLVIQLIDGRFAAIYRDGRRNWRIGQTIDVKLEEAQADPIYSWAQE